MNSREGVGGFSADERDALRADVIGWAQRDSRISGVAITGSASVQGEDRWSDVDLAFGVGDGADLQGVLGDFNAYMYDRYEALHHLDVRSGNWIYRVFLLKSTLQVDLAFAPKEDFGARAPTFKLISGSAAEPSHTPVANGEDLVGWAWLYALHVRSSIARSKLWQAEYMICGLRNQVLALACLRHDLPTRDGRGFDRLPKDVTHPLEGALVRSLEPNELKRAFQVAVAALRREIESYDPILFRRLERLLQDLINQTITL